MGSFEGNREDKDKSSRLREQGGANNGIVTQEGLGGGLWNLFHHGLWVQVEVWSSNEIGKSALDFPLPMCVLLVVWLHAVYEVRADEVWNSDASAAKGGPGGRMTFKTPHTTFFCGGSTQIKGKVVTNSTGKACPKFWGWEGTYRSQTLSVAQGDWGGDPGCCRRLVVLNSRFVDHRKWFEQWASTIWKWNQTDSHFLGLCKNYIYIHIYLSLYIYII